ncbi:uncharacterized protein LOC144448620 [Glandiceps talaboti]
MSYTPMDTSDESRGKYALSDHYVGSVSEDHTYWGRPEDMTMARPAYKVDAANPGSDCVGDTAAAMAAASIAFRDYATVEICVRFIVHKMNNNKVKPEQPGVENGKTAESGTSSAATSGQSGVATKFGAKQWLLANSKLAAVVGGVTAGVVAVAIIIAIVVVATRTGNGGSGVYNYTEVLHKSILFYEAQRSGELPSTNRIPWRGDSLLNDVGDNGEDLSGGWFDAGDHIKVSYTMAYSVSILAWGFLEFRHAYEAAGETDYMLECIKWGTDFLLKAHTDTYEFYVQVGAKDADHQYWGRPEEMNMSRPAYKVNDTVPGSDVVGASSAALAAASLVFLDYDTSYAELLLNESKALFDFADTYRGFFLHAFPEGKGIYTSGDRYADEIAWAAIWLYKATNEYIYLNKTLGEIDDMIGGRAWAFAWSQYDPGVHLLLYNLTGDPLYEKRVTKYIDEWLPGGKVQRTPKGLVFRFYWGSLRYPATTSFLALVAAENGMNREDYRKFAKSQLHYILGDTGRSFVCGFGKNPPTHPHHRSSSCPDPPAKCAWNVFSNSEPNAQVLNGALVGGPDENDAYEDIRSDYFKNEVTIDYNAGFHSAVAGI